MSFSLFTPAIKSWRQLSTTTTSKKTLERATACSRVFSNIGKAGLNQPAKLRQYPCPKKIYG